MPEPTIDEMLEFLELGMDDLRDDERDERYFAIRAILEQHRDDDIISRIASIEIEKECERQKREAIRAFVERVGVKLQAYHSPSGQTVWNMVFEELVALESEVKDG